MIFSEINQNLSCSALNFDQKDLDQEVKLPCSFTCVTKEDVLLLSMDSKVTDKRSLNCGTSVLDLATQWTFMDTGDSETKNLWCPLPSTTFYYMKRFDYYVNNELDKVLQMNVNLRRGKSLFDYTVIDLLVHDSNHYSRMFIVNPRMVIDGTARLRERQWEMSDSKACKIHVDSLSGTVEGYHKTDKCAKVVRRFLNQYAKSKKVAKNFFNVNTCPVYKLEGK